MDDRAVMRGELRRDVALDGLQLGGRLRRRQVEEQALDAPEVAAAAVERGDRVVEGRRVAALGDGIHLGAVRVHRVQERGKVVLGLDPVERRQAVRRVPGFEQRIGHGAAWPGCDDRGMRNGRSAHIIARRRDGGQGAPRRALDRLDWVHCTRGHRASAQRQEECAMNPKWMAVAIVVAVLGVALWASDKITYEGERTIYTVRCEQGKLGRAPVPGNDGRGRPVPVQGERQQAGSALLGRGVGAAFRQIQPLHGQGSRQLVMRGGRRPAADDRPSHDERPPAARGRRAAHSVPRGAEVGVVGARRRTSTSTARPGTRTSRSGLARTVPLSSRSRRVNRGRAAARIAALAEVPMRLAPASMHRQRVGEGADAAGRLDADVRPDRGAHQPHVGRPWRRRPDESRSTS